MSKRIVFIGTFTPIQKVLSSISKISGCEYISLYTTLGENGTIENLAQKMNLELIDIESLKTKEGEERLKKSEPDWLFSVNSTFVLSEQILSIPRQGALNLHPGKLPEYAGLYTYQWAIRNDEKSFATTLHWMEEKIDSGPIAYEKDFPITEKDTGLSLFMKCLNFGADIVFQALDDISKGIMPPKKDQDLSKRKLYSEKDISDGKVNWNLTNRQIFNFIRAVDYRPFESPTYNPTFLLNDTTEVWIRKAVTSNDVSSIPGEIISVNDEGIVVGTGDGLSLLISEIRLNDKSIVKRSEIAKALGIAAGSKLVLN